MRNIDMQEASIKLRISELEITNTNIHSIFVYGEAKHSFITGISDSTLTVKGLTYKDSQAPLLSFLRCEGSVDDLTVDNITSAESLITIDTSYFIKLSNMKMNNVATINGQLITLNDSTIDTLEHIQIEGIKQIIFYIAGTTIGIMNDLNITGCTQGIRALRNSQINITSSSFTNMGSLTHGSGSALYFQNSNMTLNNVLFTNNTSIDAGSIDLDCVKTKKCVYNILNSQFSNSKATTSGGAVRYNLYRPDFTGTTYTNNSAYYGPNIASYPIKIKIKDQERDEMVLTDVPSGMLYPKAIELVLEDHDKQIIKTANKALILIVPVLNSTDLKGTSQVLVREGVATFDNLYFIALPGSSNVKYKVSSKAIDKEAISLQYGEIEQNEEIDVNFRYCKPGEIQFGGVCEVCASGSFSGDWNSTECEPCIENSVCLGGEKVSVNSGYWRKSLSSEAIKCMGKDACLGGFAPEGDYPVKCAKGYDGVLCAFCKDEDGVKYDKTSEFICSKCPNPVLNILQIAGLTILVVVFLAALIVFMVRKKNDCQRSILMKIMTNYLQVLAAIYAFRIEFPDLVNDLFYTTNRVGSPTEAFLSFDCFLSDSQLDKFTNSVAYFKVFLTAIIPIILIVGAGMVWGLLYLFDSKYFFNCRRNTIISAIVILFVLHPTLTRYGLSVFECIDVDTNDQRSRLQLTEKCYSYTHLKWCLLLGVPMCTIWGVGIPLVAFVILYRNRKNLDNPRFKKYFLMIYQGFKKECYYWELVNTCRKMFILGINSFLLTYSLFYRGLFSVIAFVIVFRIQVWLEPYKRADNNSLANLEIMTETFTLFAGMLFVREEDYVRRINAIMFIFIIGLNIRFILMWLYQMLCQFRHKYRI